MPRKSEKVYCPNHPDKEMAILNEDNAKTFHTVRLATLEYGTRYRMEEKSTGFDVFSCPLCGYCEFYLTPQEMAILAKSQGR